MSNHIQRRTFLAGTLGLSALGVLPACGTADNVQQNPELTKDKVTLTLNWWGADSRTKLTQQAIELFQGDHPNITVTPQFADWTGYWDRLATTTAAGNMPDVSQFDQLYLASYAGRGTLLDLSKVSNVLNLSALPSELLDSGKVNGTQYAVPLGGTANGVIINTTLFKKYGVALPDTSTWTLEQFTATATALSKAAGGKAFGLAPFGTASFPLAIWARQRGNDLFDDQGKVALDPTVLSAFWAQELSWIDSGAAPGASQLSETANLPLDQSLLVTGKVGMGFIPAGQFTAFQSATSDYEFELANWPKPPDTKAGFQYLKPSMYWAASTRSQHPAEAALLINFLTNDVRVGELFGVDRGLPGNPAFQRAIEPNLDASGRKALAFNNAMTKIAGPASPNTPNGASGVDTILGRYNDQVLFKQSTPDAAAAAYIKELQSSIDAAS